MHIYKLTDASYLTIEIVLHACNERGDRERHSKRGPNFNFPFLHPPPPWGGSGG